MSGFRYAAVFGRNPALSIAELFAIGSAHGFSVAPLGSAAAALEGFDPALADRFGAVTKVVELLGTASSADDAVRHLAGTITKPRTGKVVFGISSYGSRPTAGLTNRVRELLDKRGIRNRFVSGTGGALSAVQVTHNRLIDKGHDWCLFESGDGWHYGRTVWVYDFAEFSRRDYDKPRSNAARGMLPPQLARAMVNLATGGQAAQSVYDPFCGSGNVLLESVALEHRTIGSDISEAAVADSRKNLEWFGRGDWQVAAADATKPLAARGIDAIVTEGYLGPPVRQSTPDSELRTHAEDVAALTVEFCKHAAAVLEPGRRLVITWPIWRRSRGQLELPIVDQVKALGYTIVRPIPPAFRPAELTDRDSILVSRPNQRVIHELFIWQRT